jgi:hypothetical protein
VDALTYAEHCHPCARPISASLSIPTNLTLHVGLPVFLNEKSFDSFNRC